MSRVVVTVDIDELNALRGAVNMLADAVKAITPTAGDEVQTEASQLLKTHARANFTFS